MGQNSQRTHKTWKIKYNRKKSAKIQYIRTAAAYGILFGGSFYSLWEILLSYFLLTVYFHSLIFHFALLLMACGSLKRCCSLLGSLVIFIL